MAVDGSTRKSIYHEEPKQRSGSSRFTGPSFSDRRAKDETVLITAAQASFDEQHRARVRKYSMLMAFRIPALVVAAVVFSATGIWWLPLIIVAVSIPLPWMAVLIANDRPPRSAEEVNTYTWGDRDVERPAIAPSQRNVIEG